MFGRPQDIGNMRDLAINTSGNNYVTAFIEKPFVIKGF